MSGTVRKRAKPAKSGRSQIRDQNSRKRNQISPVMQKVKSLLPAHKAAQTLAILLDEPLGTCQKLLCGERVENAVIKDKLLCLNEYEIGLNVLLTIGENRGVKYIEALRARTTVRALKRQIAVAEKVHAEASAALEAAE